MNMYIFHGHRPGIALRGHMMIHETTNSPLRNKRTPESYACDLADIQTEKPRGKTPLVSYDEPLTRTDNTIIQGETLDELRRGTALYR